MAIYNLEAHAVKPKGLLTSIDKNEIMAKSTISLRRLFGGCSNNNKYTVNTVKKEDGRESQPYKVTLAFKDNADQDHTITITGSGENRAVSLDQTIVENPNSSILVSKPRDYSACIGKWCFCKRIYYEPKIKGKTIHTRLVANYTQMGCKEVALLPYEHQVKEGCSGTNGTTLLTFRLRSCTAFGMYGKDKSNGKPKIYLCHINTFVDEKELSQSIKGFSEQMTDIKCHIWAGEKAKETLLTLLIVLNKLNLKYDRFSRVCQFDWVGFHIDEKKAFYTVNIEQGQSSWDRSTHDEEDKALFTDIDLISRQEVECPLKHTPP